MPVMPIDASSSTIAWSSAVTAGITFVFLITIAKFKPSIALSVAAVVGLLLWSIGIIPIGLFAVVGISMIVAIFKVLSGKNKSPTPSINANKDSLDESFIKDCFENPGLVARRLAGEAYETSYQEALKFGKDNNWPERYICELANLNTLITINSAEVAYSIPRDKISELSHFESMPFNILPLNSAKNSLIEYLVWRQYPDKADMKILMSAMNNFIANLINDNDENELLNGIRNAPFFSWLPWKKLISIGETSTDPKHVKLVMLLVENRGFTEEQANTAILNKIESRKRQYQDRGLDEDRALEKAVRDVYKLADGREVNAR